MKNPNRFYIYALWITGEDVPFYIGKGQGSRCYVHFSEKSLRADTLKNQVIKKALQAGSEVYIQTLHENLDEPTAFWHEADWIAHYGRRNNDTGCLVNLTDGGEGTSGIVLSAANIAKKRIDAKLAWKGNSERRAATSELQSRLAADPVFLATRVAAQKRTLARPENKARRRAVQKRTWEDPECRDRRIAGMRKAQSDPAYREQQSKRFRVPDSVLIAQLALNNPLFALEQSYVQTDKALTCSLVRCRHCGGEVVMKNQKMLNGNLPREHYECAQEVFNLSSGTGVYRSKGGFGVPKTIIEPPVGAEFTFKIAPAGVLFFDLDGNEISRTRLPSAYTQARITAEQKLS